MVGKNIKKFRTTKQMTQDELADRSGLSNSHISNIENGWTKVSLDAFLRIANALDVTPNELLSDTLSPRKVQFEQQLAAIVENCTPSQLALIVDLARTVVKRRD